MPPEAEGDLTGLRILAFCDHFTDDTSGGAEKVSIEVYRRLIQRGADVRVVSAIAGATEGEGEVAGIPTRVVRGKSLAGVFGAQVLVSRPTGSHRSADGRRVDTRRHPRFEYSLSRALSPPPDWLGNTRFHW